MKSFPWKSIRRAGVGTVALAAAQFIVAQFAGLPASAADYTVGSIHISQPWARATPKGAASAPAI